MKAGDQLEVIGPKPAVLREGADKASAKVGALQPGSSHEVISLARTASGTTRVELAELGWTSAVTSNGKPLLQPAMAL